MNEYELRKQRVCREVQEMSQNTQLHPVVTALIILIVRVSTKLDVIICLLSERGEKG